MDKQKILEIIKKQKSEQAKKYYVCMNSIIKKKLKLYKDESYAKYFLKYN